MTLVMDKTEAIAPECTLDLENATWTCTEHGTTMKIETGEDCPACLLHRQLSDELIETWTG